MGKRIAEKRWSDSETVGEQPQVCHSKDFKRLFEFKKKIFFCLLMNLTVILGLHH